MTFGYGARFPAKYQEALYLCDWSYGKLYALHLKPKGSTYTGELEEFLAGTPLALTDVVINPKDGAMYFAVGGRMTQSGFYRVTYDGNEPTAESVPVEGRATFEARAVRHELERFHGRREPKAIEAAWPYLGHPDRFIRWAARVAIEFQDPSRWRERALAESSSPEAALERPPGPDPCQRPGPGPPAQRRPAAGPGPPRQDPRGARPDRLGHARSRQATRPAARLPGRPQPLRPAR